MSDPASGRADPASAQSSEPAEVTLDVDHLRRMTLGDRDLEREVLQLFDRQTGMLAERLREAPATLAASCAHTLKGSARGIGAWRLAHAAERVEHVVAAGETDLTAAVAQLVDAVDETRTAIAGQLRLN